MAFSIAAAAAPQQVVWQVARAEWSRFPGSEVQHIRDSINFSRLDVCQDWQIF